MTELSGFWTTTGTATGDQQASYTQIHWSQALRIVAGCHGFEGVAPDYLNELACTATSANTVSMNTGGALVDGKWYLNDAAQDIVIPSASGAGNTRIDRIVLKCDWANYNVSAYRLAGTDDLAPTAPTITQNTGSTYEILLYQALVDTSGNVVLTDERTLAKIAAGTIADDAVTTDTIGDVQVTLAKMAVNSIDSDQYVDGSIDTAHLADDAVTGAKIADDAIDSNHYVDGSIDAAHIADDAIDSNHYVDGSIDTAHIADAQITLDKMAVNSIDSDQYVDGSIDTAHLANDAVDDTKVGNRVIQMIRRVGGSNTNWNTVGATAYTPTTVIMQVGAVTTYSTGSVTVSFPVAFSAVPLVLLTSTVGYSPGYTGVSANGVNIVAYDGATLKETTVNWLAIGPE